MKRIALVGALAMVATACGDTGTVVTSPPTLPPATSATTTVTSTAPPTTSVVPTAVEVPPWASTAVAVTEVPDTLVTQWEQSDVKGSCSAMYSVTPPPAAAAIRSANFSGGWAVAWDMPDGRGRLPSGEYCADCGRGAFGIAGSLGVAAGDETDIWDEQLAWSDGSKAGYGFEGLGDGSSGEPLLMYLLVKNEGCLYNVWSFLGEDHLLGLVDGLRFVDGLRGEPSLWRNELPPPEVVEAGEPAWVTAPPLTATDVSDLYSLEWEGEANAPASCPMLAYADLGPEASGAVIRRATSEGEMLLAWDRPSGPGHDGSSEPCVDCGRGAIGLGTFLGGQIGDRAITRRWSDGSEAATFAGFYGTEAYLRPAGFDCIYWMWSHLGEDHLDYLFSQLRRVEGYP